jgi:uncharacterized RDD family membrane protein YckC
VSIGGGAAEAIQTEDHEVLLSTGTEGPAPLREAAPLKQAVAERLAAHRSRRASQARQEAQAEAAAEARAEAARNATRRGASMVREAVAARYKESQSYREFLAAEAERALQQAQAEAEIAARNALAVAEAQQKLLTELDQWNRPGPTQLLAEAEVRDELAHALADIALGAQELIAEPRRVDSPGLTVLLSPDIKPATPGAASAPRIAYGDSHDEELAELDHEIAFRAAAEPELPAIASEPIPANIIEFPRQLIASRKARPRRAEGPLLDETPPEPQLRIFEVEPEQIGTAPEPAAAEPAGACEWQSLLLDGHAAAHPAVQMDAQQQLAFQPETAPLHRRLMAAAVDAICIAAAFVAAATVVAAMSGPALRELPLPLAAGAAAATLAVFTLLFQMLCFTLSDATPGMRYARIALCTFGDDNPSRKAMRRRLFAALLSACPLGLGFLWALLDDDKLAWHDRISRIYQRSY